MFCHECGCQIEVTDRFCPQCGTKLYFDEEYSLQERTASCGGKYFDAGCIIAQAKSTVTYGYILTHIKALADQLHTSHGTILEILDEFATLRSKEGICYRIIDMGEFSDSPKDANWLQYHQVVTAVYAKDISSGISPDYLFIIGGADVVPMPALPIKMDKADNIDSDILYGYLYGRQTEKMVLDMSIFRYDIMLLCGRLPLASDTTIEDFVKMLSNVLIAGQRGLLNLNLHVQCDPHWKKVTSLVAKDLREYMPQRDVDDEYFLGPVMLTPKLQPGTDMFDRAFPYRQASIFYYNLHGTAVPGLDYFSGQALNGKNFFLALHPSNMAAVIQPNMVITEACYGGWFRVSLNQNCPKRKHETVLLAALHANTVSYVGSSRIAYGSVDGPSVSQSQADIIAHVYLKALYAGYPAGTALYLAKKAIFDSNCNGENPLTLITIAEFNLFGDPSLTAVSHPGAYSPKSCKEALSKVDKNVRVEHKVEYDASQRNGILAQVRSMVNRNLQEINSITAKYLYEKYGITPRRLELMISTKSGYTDNLYTCFYSVDNGSWAVEMDAKTGQILYSVCSK